MDKQHPAVTQMLHRQELSVPRMMMMMAHGAMRLNATIPTREAILMCEEKDES